MIAAEKFLEEVENKPVYYHIYCYFDKKLDRYNQPVINVEEPKFVYESTVASIVKGKFPKETAQDMLLVYLGKFDLKTGEFDIFKEPQIIVDCGKYIQQKVDA